MIRPKRAKTLIQKVETFVWWWAIPPPPSPPTIQTSVKFRDFGELHLRSFSKNHFEIWQIYFSAVLTGFSLTVPCKKLKNRGRIYLKEVTYINRTFLLKFLQMNTVFVQLLTHLNRILEVHHYIAHLVILKCKAFLTHVLVYYQLYYLFLNATIRDKSS